MTFGMVAICTRGNIFFFNFYWKPNIVYKLHVGIMIHATMALLLIIEFSIYPVPKSV